MTMFKNIFNGYNLEILPKRFISWQKLYCLNISVVNLTIYLLYNCNSIQNILIASLHFRQKSFQVKSGYLSIRCLKEFLLSKYSYKSPQKTNVVFFSFNKYT